jgi:transcriptional regulator with PAS, ATPase and Fis domain
VSERYHDGGIVMDAEKMFNSLEVAIVGSDSDMNVIYANEKSRKMFKDMPNQGNLVGTSLTEYHKPETVEIIKSLFKAFRNKEKKLDYYKMELPGGKATVVQFPFYENEEFAGAVEFIIESALE